MDRELLLKLNGMIKEFMIQPTTPSYPSPFDGSNVNLELARIHTILGEFYQLLIDYALPYGVQVIDKTGNPLGERKYIFRVVNYDPDCVNTEESNGSITMTSPIHGQYKIVEEILLYSSNEAKFKEVNEEILKRRQ